MQEEGLDERKYRLKLRKADAIRGLRRHIDTSARRPRKPGVERAIVRYLAQVVHAHLDQLFSTYPLPPSLDAKAFAESALADARKHADAAIVDEIASRILNYVTDLVEVEYLHELGRKAGYQTAARRHASSEDVSPGSGSIGLGAFVAELQAEIPEEVLQTRRRRSKLRKRLPSSVTVTRPRSSERAPSSDDRLRQQRAEMLKGYKKDTKVKSDRAIYSCAGKQNTHSCHKPQFLDWKKGKLAPKSQPCKSLERFLLERRPPPTKAVSDRENLPILPTSTN
ncbi:MAG: hypothetical protein KIT09_31840 [Bryobacteraceae bacterium]|nr:hypothetical protein [Bryobacteraceae bacterium]